jgi:hypothetical protein
MFGQIAANLAFKTSHFSMPSSVSALMASAGHSGSQTPQIDAFVRLDSENVVPLVETIDGTDLHAVGVFALDAGFGDDKRHLGSPNHFSPSGN